MPVGSAENVRGAAVPFSRPLERLLIDEFDRVGLAFMVGRRDEQQRLPAEAIREAEEDRKLHCKVELA